jgi:hypothetical protein
MSARTARKRTPWPGLVHRPQDGTRPPIDVGCWAVVGSHDLAEHPWLALVTEGPQFQRGFQRGSGYGLASQLIGDVFNVYWKSHTGLWFSDAELTRLDLTEILEDGAKLVEEIRRGAFSDDRDARVLRVLRAKELALSPHSAKGGPRRPPNDQVAAALPLEAQAQLRELAATATAVVDAELAWTQFRHFSLRYLLDALHLAGMCELARDCRWWGNLGEPHPRAGELKR